MIHNVEPLNAHVVALPEVEQQAAMVLMFGLIRLNDYVSNFAASVALLDFSDAKAGRLTTKSEWPTDPERARVVATLGTWRGVAARDAAMTIYHFGMSFDGIKSNLDEVPTAKPQIDIRNLRHADKLFRSKLPHFEEIRNATAHVADLTQSLGELKRNVASGSFTWGRVLGKRYEVTIKGHHHSFEVSKTTLNVLIDVTNMAYSSFPAWRDGLPKLTPKS